MTKSSDPRGHIIIPAFNEAAVIGRCLSALVGVRAHVVVVANGCTDDTAARARQHNVEVIELEMGSKVAALNAGDDACVGRIPRIYLDADVVLAARDAEMVIDLLGGSDSPTVCAPRMVLDDAAASRVVRWFYRAFRRLPYVNVGMVGSGCYAVNDQGRQRWTHFPAISGDDFFVQGLFAEDERVVVPETSFRVFTPTTLRGLLRVRTRAYQGNRDAIRQGMAGSMTSSRESSLAAAMSLCRSERLMIGPLLLYYVINTVAVVRARTRGTRDSWLTDVSSRGGAS